MYKKTNGTWKSDFRMFGERYQHSWNTKNKAEATKLENELKDKIKNIKGNHNFNHFISKPPTTIDKFTEAKEVTQTLIIETSKLLELFMVQEYVQHREQYIQHKVYEVASYLSKLSELTNVNIQISLVSKDSKNSTLLS